MEYLNRFSIELTKEIAGHIIDKINDGIIDDSNQDDWHYHCFNEDYYIIGYYEANQWLKRHNIDAFKAIEIVRDYEEEHFGKFTTKINSESIANMLAYIFGKELLSNYYDISIKKLKKELTKLIED